MEQAGYSKTWRLFVQNIQLITLQVGLKTYQGPSFTLLLFAEELRSSRGYCLFTRRFNTGGMIKE